MIKDIARFVKRKRKAVAKRSLGTSSGSNVGKVAGDYCQMNDGTDGIWVEGSAAGHCSRATKKN